MHTQADEAALALSASAGDGFQRASLEHLGAVVLPVAQHGHAELRAMPALLILLLALRMHVRLVPARREVPERTQLGSLPGGRAEPTHTDIALKSALA